MEEKQRCGGIPLMSGDYRFLALGDSYTHGEAVDSKDSWPMVLVSSLKKRGRMFRDPSIIAKTGWTTDELLEGITVVDPTGPFELVSLLIGVNNQYRGRTADDYRVEFRALLSLAIQFGSGDAGKVVVLSMPDWGATPFAEGKDRVQIAKETDLFNEVNRAESADRHVHYVDITESSRRGLGDPSLLTTDGLHPSGLMYREWAGLVLDTIMPE